MQFEDRVVFIPLMPPACFSALVQLFGGNPFGVSSKVNQGDFVPEGTPVATYKQGLQFHDCVSVVAPFPGKVLLLPIRESLDVDWEARLQLPVRHSTLFALQPAIGTTIDGATKKSHVPVAAYIRAFCVPRRSLLERLFNVDNRPHDYLQVLRELEKLEAAIPRVAPKGVNYDEYFKEN